MPPIRSILPPKGPWLVLGLMSGTSADGTDAALVEVDPEGYEAGRPFKRLLGHHHLDYAPALRARVLAAAANRLSPAELCVLQRQLGEAHADCARALCQTLNVHPQLISLHGQTVQHHPDQGASLQLADPYVLVEALPCPIVWDLRRRDLALGGQGAPLVPLTELWLQGQDHAWVALNLGGIANATVWDGATLKAWDLGPAMSLLDLAATRWLGCAFDEGGARATGRVHETLLGNWLADPYFQLPLPKSTGREHFGEAWLNREAEPLETLSLPDRLATLAAFTAEAVASELRRWGPLLPQGTPLRISGGGAQHVRVRQELSLRLPGLRLEDDAAFPNGAREAVSWALLGAASALGLPGNLPQVTGASGPAVLGSWVLP